VTAATTSQAAPAARVRIWDLPVRLLHWTLVACVLSALGVALLVDDERPAFVLHMLLGLGAAGAVVLRIAWGLVGSRWARFSSFLHGPAALVAYLREAGAGRDRPCAGHNPGASWAIYALLLLTLVLAATGLLVRQGGERLGDLHAAAAWVLVAAVAAHLAGLAWHTARHRDGIILAMVTGLKRARPDEAISSSHPAAAGLLALLLVGWGAVLFTGVDLASRDVRLPVAGLSLPLGKTPTEGGPGGDEAEADDD
jgi:cytochrome b